MGPGPLSSDLGRTRHCGLSLPLEHPHVDDDVVGQPHARSCDQLGLDVLDVVLDGQRGIQQIAATGEDQCDEAPLEARGCFSGLAFPKDQPIDPEADQRHQRPVDRPHDELVEVEPRDLCVIEANADTGCGGTSDGEQGPAAIAVATKNPQPAADRTVNANRAQHGSSLEVSRWVKDLVQDLRKLGP